MKFKRVLRYIINLRQLVINLIYFCNRGQFVLLLKKGLVSLLCFNEQNSSIFCCLKVVSCKSMQTDILLRSPLQITSWCDILPFFLPHYCPFLLPRPCPHFPFLHRFYTQPPPPLFFSHTSLITFATLLSSILSRFKPFLPSPWTPSAPASSPQSSLSNGDKGRSADYLSNGKKRKAEEKEFMTDYVRTLWWHFCIYLIKFTEL